MSIKAISLFSGCGGLDLGFHEVGVDIIAAIDNDEASIKCYNHNFKKGGAVLDVTNPEFYSFLDKINNVDLVIGGFPCQGFSKSGPKKREDPRNTLYQSMLHTVEKLRPKVFVAENVDGLAQNYKGELLNKILDDFKGLGYNVEYRIINAADFGVPQHRRRIIFIGTNNNLPIVWPTPTHAVKIRNGEFKSQDLLKFDYTDSQTGIFKGASTIRESIGNIPKGVKDQITIGKIKPTDLKIIKRIKEGQKLCNVRFAATSVFTWQIPEVFGEVSKKEVIILETIARNRRKKIFGNIPNGNPLTLDNIATLSKLNLSINDLKPLVEKGYIKEIDNKYDIKGAMFCSGLYKRPLYDEPSPTILTIYHNPRYLLHPTENRPLTIRECARLQSFPDDFEFIDSGIGIEDSYRLIGNAVPPRLAYEIAKKVITLIPKRKKHETSTVKQGQKRMAAGI